MNPDVSPPAIRPLASVGIRNGMLITPTRSSMGMSERRMARIRMASPFPAWISWRRRTHHIRRGTRDRHEALCTCDGEGRTSPHSRASLERSGPTDRSEPRRRSWWRFPCEWCRLPLPPWCHYYETHRSSSACVRLIIKLTDDLADNERHIMIFLHLQYHTPVKSFILSHIITRNSDAVIRDIHSMLVLLLLI